MAPITKTELIIFCIGSYLRINYSLHSTETLTGAHVSLWTEWSSWSNCSCGTDAVETRSRSRFTCKTVSLHRETDTSCNEVETEFFACNGTDCGDDEDSQLSLTLPEIAAIVVASCVVLMTLFVLFIILLKRKCKGNKVLYKIDTPPDSSGEFENSRTWRCPYRRF